MIKIPLWIAFFAAFASAQPTVSAVVNDTNFLPQLCPGALAAIYGTNFGTNTSNLTVTVGGKSAYVYPTTLSPGGQIAVQIPLELSAGATTLTVTVGGVASAPFNITLAAFAPGFATQNQTGSGLANIYTGASALVTSSSPAHSGDALLTYVTGLGQTTPATPTGVPATVNQVSPLPALTIGGISVKVAYAGLTNPGLYQTNFTVPAGLQGTQPIVLTIGGVSSSNEVTIALAGLSYVVSNATFTAPGTVSPGSIATVFANGLATTTSQTSIFPGTISSGVQVTFNGTPAPLFHVIGSANPQQIDLLVPSNLPTTGTVNVQLTTSAAFYPNYTLTMVPANPGFYRIQDPKVTTRENVIAQFNGTAWLALPVSTTAALGLPACTSTTNVLSECGQPATIGDYLVLYATGLGLTTPGGDPNGKPLATGAIPPIDGSVLYETPTTPVVTIGGVPAKVLYSGLAPGYPGEYEVVVQVPTGVASGDDVPVTVTILGASDSSTTISIQPRP